MTISQSVVSSLKNYKYSENAFLPKIVTVPLTQEYNCSCKCLVKPGDYVKEGDVIAEPEFSDELNNLSYEEKQIKLKYYTKIHSPIPGKIIDVVSVLTPNGSYEKSVRIRLEGKFSYTGHILENNKINKAFFTKEQIIQTIADKGIVNTFFTPKPVSLAKQIDSLTDKANLIVRLYDDDTLRIADSLLTKFHIKEIIEGARIIAGAMGAETRILFVGDIKSDLAKNYAAEITPKENETFLFIKIKKYPTGFKSEIINNFYKNYKKNAP
ncbi:MAG: hypothetical protein MJ188_07985, partial [Treponema sp.]|nr:hypothetical protein [Treponema sp.]